MYKVSFKIFQEHLIFKYIIVLPCG